MAGAGIAQGVSDVRKGVRKSVTRAPMDEDSRSGLSYVAGGIAKPIVGYVFCFNYCMRD
jgi:hypothetical protein